MLMITQPVRIKQLIKQEPQGDSVGNPDTLETGRSAVLFRFVLGNFKVKIKAFAQGQISKSQLERVGLMKLLLKFTVKKEFRYLCKIFRRGKRE